LAAGSKIREHRDLNLGDETGEVRLHIPIVTNPAVEFFLDGVRIVMNEGECWYLNFSLPHRVDNRGVTDRIHLVIDCQVNDWLRELIESDGASDQNVDLETSTNEPAGFEAFQAAVLRDATLQHRLRKVSDRD